MLAFPKIQVGNPLSHEALTVFPLFAQAKEQVDYLLSDKALAGGTVTVEELNEAGSVPNLIVNNLAESLVLFLEGEELRGAKQNRVLNTSVLAAAKSKTTIPVSCVEEGRWRYKSPQFASAGSHASSKLRHVLKKSVSLSAKAGRGHGSDQGGVWQEVGRQMNSLGSHSPTGAMADTYEAYQNRLVEFQDRLKYVEGATGLAVGIGKKIVSLDVFDKPSTCREVWKRLLTGVALDALEAGSTEDRAEAAVVQQSLDLLTGASWQKTMAVGAGDEYRFDTEDDQHASVLVFKDTVVHGSLVTTK
jgi:hypothetical protein